MSPTHISLHRPSQRAMPENVDAANAPAGQTESLSEGPLRQHLTTQLDAVERQLRRGEVSEAMERLFLTLGRFQQQLKAEQWREAIENCRRHRLLSALLEDPLIRHAFTRPRGYPGDAELLDLIYYGPDGSYPRTKSPSALGREIFSYLFDAPAAQAVRERRRLIAKLVTATVGRLPRPRLLAVAAGHLREFELLESHVAEQLGEWVALDQDAESLQQIERSYGRSAIRTVHASVKDLLRPTCGFGEFDFVYAAGLYDYLTDSFAQRLTQHLFGMLRPGGQLLVANFVPGIRDRGFMEAYLRWDLIYRSPAKVREVAALVSNETCAIDVSLDNHGNIARLLLTKRD